MKVEDIISDAQIDEVHGDIDCGDLSKRDFLNYGLLGCICDYVLESSGMLDLCVQHGLVYDDEQVTITQRGQKYLWATFGKSGV